MLQSGSVKVSSSSSPRHLHIQSPEYCTPRQDSPAAFGSRSVEIGVEHASFTYSGFA